MNSEHDAIRSARNAAILELRNSGGASWVSDSTGAIKGQSTGSGSEVNPNIKGDSSSTDTKNK